MNLIDAKCVTEFANPRDDAPLPSNVRLGHDVWIERSGSFAAFRSESRPGCVLGDRVRVYGWTKFHVEPEGAIEVGDDTLLSDLRSCARAGSGSAAGS